MWVCKNCNSEGEDSFDSCWNCGHTQEGSPPGAEWEASVRENLTSTDLDNQLQARFVCVKCGQKGGVAKRIAAAKRAIVLHSQYHPNVFLSVSCGRCSYTEMYNPEIFEAKDNFSEVLDLLFGK